MNEIELMFIILKKTNIKCIKDPNVNPDMLLLLKSKTKQNTKNISNTQQDIDVRKDFSK